MFLRDALFTKKIKLRCNIWKGFNVGVRTNNLLAGH